MHNETLLPKYLLKGLISKSWLLETELMSEAASLKSAVKVPLYPHSKRSLSPCRLSALSLVCIIAIGNNRTFSAVIFQHKLVFKLATSSPASQPSGAMYLFCLLIAILHSSAHWSCLLVIAHWGGCDFGSLVTQTASSSSEGLHLSLPGWWVSSLLTTHLRCPSLTSSSNSAAHSVYTQLIGPLPVFSYCLCCWLPVKISITCYCFVAVYFISICTRQTCSHQMWLHVCLLICMLKSVSICCDIQNNRISPASLVSCIWVLYLVACCYTCDIYIYEYIYIYIYIYISRINK